MPITERAAADLLRPLGIPREQARLLLKTGICGRGSPIGPATGYDEARVRELAGRPCVDEARLCHECPQGVFVARLARHRTLDVAVPWQDQAERLAVQPRLPRMTDVFLGVKLRMAGRLPWIVTVSGLVVFGGEATSWSAGSDGTIVFALQPPGRWFDALERRWFAFGRGRHWFFWDPWRLQQ